MKLEIEKLRDKVRGYLKKWGKMTLRQIFYRLVSEHLIENTLNRYKWLSRQLIKIREEDEFVAKGVIDRARPRLMYFKDDLWEGQGKYLEIWVEKDALSPKGSLGFIL